MRAAALERARARRGHRPRDGDRARGPGLIFEQFGRVARHLEARSGLGLYISRAIAEAHGGTLEVCSTPGAGSTFTLTLPRGELASARASRQLAARARGRASATQRAQLGRREHDRLAAEREHLADQPVGAADRPFRERGAVDERARALLDLPARDLGRVPDAGLVASCSSDGSKPSRGVKPRRSSFALRVRSRR